VRINGATEGTGAAETEPLDSDAGVVEPATTSSNDEPSRELTYDKMGSITDVY
jgi:hypothetical protein